MIQDIELKYTFPDERIKWAREYNQKCLLHVHGIGLDRALEKINNYENDAQKIARDKFAISNKWISDRLLRPTDNVFSAKGGYKHYHFKSNQEENERKFIENLMDVYSGYTLTQYIHRIWFDKYVVDPNGLIFLEVSEDGGSIYPTYKSIQSIKNYAQDGIKVDWVIFEPDEKELDDKNQEKAVLFWAVDEFAYYRYRKEGDKFELKYTKTHIFGEVPARLASDIEDHVTGWKKSPIDQQIELLNKYMVDSSVLNIVEYFHSYPQQWTYVSECGRCGGSGVVHDGVRMRDGSMDTTCPICKGSGQADRKDVTDIIKLKVPGIDDKAIDPPSGYIYMPVDAWTAMRTSVERSGDLITYSHWGTSLEYGANKGEQYATATGRFIDVQPVNNKLNRYTESVELIHGSLVDIYGKFYFRETYEKSEVVYGRRYLIETPDQLSKTYADLKSNKVENTLLFDSAWDKYLESEYRENDQMYAYYKKLSCLDPMLHLGLDDVMKTANQTFIDRKIYLSDFKSDKEISYIIKTPLVKLKQEYINYINEKKKNEQFKDVSETPD